MTDPMSWELSWPYILAAFAGAYVLGSVPFGLVLTRLGGIADIRKLGSGNIGATNVLRTGRKGLAALTLLLDAAKGAVAVAIGGLYGPEPALVAGAGAFVGHVFPVWLRFDGGKGVATAFGVLLALSWPAAVAALAVWIVVLAATRYSSLAALVASAAAPGFCYWLADPRKAGLMIALGAVMWLRHAGNIRRLLRGEEPKVGRK